MRIWLLALALVFTGCTMGATNAQLRTRASFDLDCDEDKLELVELDDRTTGVKGCGRRATYVEQCKPCANGYQACDCTWLLNADLQQR